MVLSWLALGILFIIGLTAKYKVHAFFALVGLRMTAAVFRFFTTERQSLVRVRLGRNIIGVIPGVRYQGLDIFDIGTVSEEFDGSDLLFIIAFDF